MSDDVSADLEALMTLRAGIDEAFGCRFPNDRLRLSALNRAVGELEGMRMGLAAIKDLHKSSWVPQSSTAPK